MGLFDRFNAPTPVADVSAIMDPKEKDTLDEICNPNHDTYDKLIRSKKEIERLYKFTLLGCKERPTDYMRGQYNALEMVMSIFEARDPQFYEEENNIEVDMSDFDM